MFSENCVYNLLLSMMFVLSVVYLASEALDLL